MKNFTAVFADGTTFAVTAANARLANIIAGIQADNTGTSVVRVTVDAI